MQISFNVFLPWLLLPLLLSCHHPLIMYLVWCFVLLVAGFSSSFFRKIAFSFKCRTAKKFVSFSTQKTCWCLLWYFYKVPSFCLSVDVAGFVSSASAVDVVDGFCSVLGSACCFWFWFWVWFLECCLIPKAFFDLVRFEVDVRSLFTEFSACWVAFGFFSKSD